MTYIERRLTPFVSCLTKTTLASAQCLILHLTSPPPPQQKTKNKKEKQQQKSGVQGSSLLSSCSLAIYVENQRPRNFSFIPALERVVLVACRLQYCCCLKKEKRKERKAGGGRASTVDCVACTCMNAYRVTASLRPAATATRTNQYMVSWKKLSLWFLLFSSSSNQLHGCGFMRTHF